ncbi:MAG: sulfatase-like hydrolase/transferase [Planctomycetes bacterium]|nr:sulfatase-like hydrolase/transferase [Planctomycetota bacterium]
MYTWSQRLWALIGGACLASLIASFLGGANHSWYALILPLVLGNIVVASILSLVLAPFSSTPNHSWGKFSFMVCLVPSLGAIGVTPSFLAVISLITLAILMLKFRSMPTISGRSNSIIILLALCAVIGGSYKNHFYLKGVNEALSVPRLAKSESTGLVAPDIILVSLDTLRADAIVGERSPHYDLPFFDGMRDRGEWWDYAYSSSNQTLPGHASMLSGKDALASGVRYNFNQLPGPDKLHLISEYFKKADYKTAGVISNALIAGNMGFSRGFDLYDDITTPRFGLRTACENYLSQASWLGILAPRKIVSVLLSKTNFRALQKPPRGMGAYSMRERGKVINEQAVSALDQLYENEQPFFFFLHYIDVHHPYGAPQPFDGLLTKGLPPLPERYQPNERLDGMITLDQLDVLRAELKSDDLQIHGEALAAADYYHQIYLENLLFLDSLLEEIHGYVEKSQRPTLWVITADHGEHFAENDVILHGNHMFQDSIRVPFILAGPGIDGNIRRGGIPDVADIGPTLLEYAGIAIPQTMNGRSLLGGHDLPPKLHVVTDDVRLMLRMADYKLIAVREGDSVKATHVYNLAEDPNELNNLLGRSAIQEELLDALGEELQRDTFEGGDGNLSAEQNAALDELGYADSHEDH